MRLKFVWQVGAVLFLYLIYFKYPLVAIGILCFYLGRRLIRSKKGKNQSLMNAIKTHNAILQNIQQEMQILTQNQLEMQNGEKTRNDNAFSRYG